mmetsp:Transcript_42012/g.71832  ORF Transcript_42012/g.71832 Transcript_42012/m.71832 type:complete len:229 (-) Transcript_42012:598-1284(-)
MELGLHTLHSSFSLDLEPPLFRLPLVNAIILMCTWPLLRLLLLPKGAQQHLPSSQHPPTQHLQRHEGSSSRGSIMHFVFAPLLLEMVIEVRHLRLGTVNVMGVLPMLLPPEVVAIGAVIRPPHRQPSSLSPKFTIYGLVLEGGPQHPECHRLQPVETILTIPSRQRKQHRPGQQMLLSAWHWVLMVLPAIARQLPPTHPLRPSKHFLIQAVVVVGWIRLSMHKRILPF